MSSNEKQRLSVSASERSKIDRKVLAWLNQYPGLPISVVKTEPQLPINERGMALSASTNAYYSRHFILGFSHVVDSLSAIRYAKVKVIRDEYGIARKFETEGDFPRYGNDDDRADEIAVWLLKTFLHKVKKYHTYRNSEATTSILTITSNVPERKSPVPGQGRFHTGQPQRGIFQNQEQQLGLHYFNARPVRQDTAVRGNHDRDIHRRALRCGAKP